jgi:hypothetical protein
VLAQDLGDDLDEAADFLIQFATKVRHLGPDGYLQSVSYREGDPILGAPSDPPAEGIED